MMTTRRSFLLSASSVLLGTVAARAQLPDTRLADLRGSLDAVDLGMRPGGANDQSRELNTILQRASAERKPVFLPPGTYLVSNLNLPDFVHLTGIAGATRLVYGGEGHFILAENAGQIRLSELTIDGDNRWLADYAGATVQITGTDHVNISGCEFLGSRKHAVSLDASGGTVEHNRITGAADAALYCIEGSGFRIADNDIADCANGGILIHRWKAGRDGSLVTGNRVERIGARSGGTGQNGNGINVYNADNVLIANNAIGTCAFSAIRCNSGSDVQIIGNQCHDSGETAIYAEFAFEGAVVANNVVDGAANGISITNFDNGGRLATVSGNLVRNLRLEGPYPESGFGFGWGIGVEADTAVSGNVIDNAPRAGIVLGWGPYLRGVAAIGNVVRDSAVGIAVSVAEGAQTTQISNNILQNTADGAIIGYLWKDPATRDLAKDGASGFAHLDISGNTVL
jgi:uncharacterized secreted repeat protein (TIGR03808 family)